MIEWELMVSHFFMDIDQFSEDQKIHENIVFKFDWPKNFNYILTMTNKVIIQFKRNKRIIETLEVPVEMLKELRHHVSYVHKNMTDGTWIIYITINIK